MKPMNYMELLGDLPEDLVDCAFLTADSGKQQAQNGQAIRHQKGEYTMEKSRAKKTKPAPFQIGRAGIAAAVALCIGLNAALIYGIGKMKSSGSITPGAALSGEAEPEGQEVTAKPHMEIGDLFEPMPSRIIVKIVNDTEQDHILYHPQYIVTQNGVKVADCEPYLLYFDDIAKGESNQQLLFPAPLSQGSYTLVNVAEDGETEGVLGHLDFEITADSDRTETVPDVIGTEYEKARETLQETGFLVDKRSAHNPEFPAGTVISIDPEPGTELAFGSYVRVTVSLGKHQDTGTAPNFIGMEWERARQTAKESGIQPIRFLMDSDEYPAGTVAAQGIVYNTSDSGSFIVLYVAKEDGEQSIAMKFTSLWCQPDKDYYYYLRNEAGEIIGATLPFSMIGTGGSTTDFLYPDCSEENTKATAVLVDLETKRETNIGSYILHPETATYEIISEDIEAAFNALNG